VTKGVMGMRREGEGWGKRKEEGMEWVKVR